MLAKRIIPTLLCRGRTLVKGKGFHSWRSVGVVEQAVRIHQARGVDELVLLDISATKEGRGPDLALVEELAADCFSPLAVGGGVRSVADVRALLRAGADKIVIGTAALRDPDIVRKLADAVGSQAIVVSIDFVDGYVAIESGQNMTSRDPERFAMAMEQEGAGEILLTSILSEGGMSGYDLAMTYMVASSVGIPVIAHGGCGTYEHMREAIEVGASAVASGAMFQFTDNTPLGAAQYLNAQGIEVRLAMEEAIGS